MGISRPRDLDELRRAFASWLRAWRPGAGDIDVAPLVRPSTGLSSETIFAEVDWELAGVAVHESWVLRLPPHDEGLFPRYDVGGQGRLQQVLAGAGVRAVAPVAVEDDPRFLGAPFLVMPRVAGRVVQAEQPYLRTGWLAESPGAGQARLQGELVEALAGIHRLDWEALGCAAVLGERLAGHGREHLGAELDYWDRYLAWAGEGGAPAVFADGLAWCRAHRPDPEPPPSLLWGDVQLGNVLVDDTMAIAAVLDFEMATIGPAEVDLAWFLVLHDMAVDRCGRDLPGFASRAATISAYQARLGRSLADLRWYEAFAALRSGAILVRAARLLARMGIDDSWLTQHNPTVELLGALIGA